MAIQWLAVAGALILAPIGEEFFFRGMLQSGIKKAVPRRWGSLRHRWIAIVVTALLFGLMHYSVPHHVPPLIVFGLILGYLYEKSGVIIVPVLVHILFNGKSLLWHALS